MWWKSKTKTFVLKWLDCMFCNLKWRMKFSNAIVHHLEFEVSDHWPILLENISEKMPMGRYKRKKRKIFHFKEMWLRDEESKNIVDGAWGKRLWGIGIWLVVLWKSCRIVLLSYKFGEKECYGSQKKDIDEQRKELALLRKLAPFKEISDKMHEVKKRLNILLKV